MLFTIAVVLSVLVAIGMALPFIVAWGCDHMWMVISRNDREIIMRCHHCKKMKTEKRV